MANFDTSKQGMKVYARVLESARETGTVGVHHHLRNPQPPTSRLGYVGKPVKAKEPAKVKAERKTRKVVSAKDKEIARLKEVLVNHQVSADMEEKFEAMKRAKAAAKMEVPQYGKVLTVKDCKNTVG
jgi:hypothetical protein